MFGIDDAILGSVAGSVVGGLMGGGGSSATQTASKAPWSAAAPWLQQNIQTGQNLQNYYQANPFTQLQQNAYGNAFSGNDWLRQFMNNYGQSMNGFQGFNRSNPTAKPVMASVPVMQSQPLASNLGFGGGATAALQQAAVPQAAPVAASDPYNGLTYRDWQGWFA